MRDARRSRARRTAAAESGPPLITFVASWQLALEAANKNPKTVRSYLDSIRALISFLADQGMPTDTEGIDPSHIRAFVLAEEQRTSPASAAVHFRNLRVFFGWLATEGERLERAQGFRRAESDGTRRNLRRPLARGLQLAINSCN
jgi:integrase/recombinase XerD